MAKLESFSGLTRKQEDLLKKNYCFGALAMAYFKVQKPEFCFKARGSQSSGPSKNLLVAGSSSIEYKRNTSVFKFKRSTEGVFNYSIEYVPEALAKELKLGAESQLTRPTQKLENSGFLEYCHPNARGKLSISDSPLTLKGALTLGYPEYGLAVDTKFDLNSQKLTTYNAALYWFRKHRKIVVKHLSKNPEILELGDVLVSYYQKLDSKTHIGSSVSFNAHNKTTSVEFGGDYKIDESTKLKGKVATNGIVSVAYQKQLSDSLGITVASQVDAKKVSSNSINDFKFGFRLDFNH